MRVKNVAVTGLLCLVFVALPVLSYAQGGKIALKLNLKEGQRFSVIMNNQQNISQTLQGMDQNMKTALKLAYDCQVNSVDAEGNAWIQFTYKSVKVEQDGPMGKLVYDSSDTSGDIPPPFLTYAAMVGEGFSMQMDSGGHIKDVQGVDRMIEKMVDSLGLPDSPQRDLVEKSVHDQFGDKGIKTSMEHLTAIYPEKKVGTGDTWVKKVDVQMGFPITITTTYTVKAIDNDNVVLNLKSEIRSNPEVPLSMGVGPKIYYDIAGGQNGEVTLNKSTGWAVSSQATQEMAGTVRMEGQTPDAEGLSWPIAIDGVNSLSSKFSGGN